MKKLIALFLAIVLVLALSLTFVSAADDPEPDVIKKIVLIAADDPEPDCWKPPVELV